MPQMEARVPIPPGGDDEISVVSRMTDSQRAIYTMQRKDPTVAWLLCLFLGGLGAHHFYLGKVAAGVLSILFCWTLIPLFLAFIDLFLVAGRTRRHNMGIAQRVGAVGLVASYT